MSETQSVNSIPRKQKLIEGLQRIIATDLDLPLVPIGSNKQPLGDRPLLMTDKELARQHPNSIASMPKPNTSTTTSTGN
jgi:hypothetical protein